MWRRVLAILVTALATITCILGGLALAALAGWKLNGMGCSAEVAFLVGALIAIFFMTASCHLAEVLPEKIDPSLG
jgi:hypothetical protein